MTREPTEMELRVARAIWDVRWLEAPQSIRPDWDNGSLLRKSLTDADVVDARSRSIRDARAAIRAMREPTDDMIVDGGDALDPDGYRPWDLALPAWRAMIDAASSPE